MKIRYSVYTFFVLFVVAALSGCSADTDHNIFIPIAPERGIQFISATREATNDRIFGGAYVRSEVYTFDVEFSLGQHWIDEIFSLNYDTYVTTSFNGRLFSDEREGARYYFTGVNADLTGLKKKWTLDHEAYHILFELLLVRHGFDMKYVGVYFNTKFFEYMGEKYSIRQVSELFAYFGSLSGFEDDWYSEYVTNRIGNAGRSASDWYNYSLVIEAYRSGCSSDPICFVLEAAKIVASFLENTFLPRL